MMRRWLHDAADRLETAAGIARELVGPEAPATVGTRLQFLADRLWRTAQRIGILQGLPAGLRVQVTHTLCDLFRVARRAHELALAERDGPLSDGIAAIASELQAILGELAVVGESSGEEPALARRANAPLDGNR